MGIYISGINLPRGKHSIVEITITGDGTVFTGSTDTFHKSEIRAVEIPSPHGRLIDIDEMAIDESEAYMSAQLKVTDEATRLVNAVVHSKLQLLLSDTPTVIEAEGKE